MSIKGSDEARSGSKDEGVGGLHLMHTYDTRLTKLSGRNRKQGTTRRKTHFPGTDPTAQQSRRPGARQRVHATETAERKENSSEQTYRPLGDRLGMAEPAQAAYKW